MDWVAIIGVVATILSIASIVTAFLKTSKTDGREMGQIMTELGYIKSSITTLDSKLDKQDERQREFINSLNKSNNRIGILESFQSVTNSSIDTINTHLADIDTKIDDLEKDIYNMKTEIVKHHTDSDL